MAASEPSDKEGLTGSGGLQTAGEPSIIEAAARQDRSSAYDGTPRWIALLLHTSALVDHQTRPRTCMRLRGPPYVPPTYLHCRMHFEGLPEEEVKAR